jgi:hypothetical protein
VELFDLEIEPEPLGSPTLEVEPEPIEVEPEQATPVTLRTEHGGTVGTLVPVAEILPADFPLPTLIRFVPNVALKVHAEQAAAYALSVDVTGPEGMERADLALAALRESQKAITEHFIEPVEIANRLHKRLTGLRSEWVAPGDEAAKTVGNRVWEEKRRLDAIAAAERRKAQEAADAEARKKAREEAEAAAKNQAPPQVIEELTRRVETATAPPVAAAPVATMKSTSVVTAWKARPKGTPADAEPNPSIAEMSPSQLLMVDELLKGILEKRAPYTAIEINYSILNSRAKGDQKTFNIPGFEAFEHGGVRAKGGRRR